jgi:hypothetical protein
MSEEDPFAEFKNSSALHARAGTGPLIMDAYITADFPGWAHELKHDSY